MGVWDAFLAFGLALSCRLLLWRSIARLLGLRAALAAPAPHDPAPPPAAKRSAANWTGLPLYARSIGCDNQQFLIFGQAPPPQCAGSSRDAGDARADRLPPRPRHGDSGQRHALSARYNAVLRSTAAARKELVRKCSAAVRRREQRGAAQCGEGRRRSSSRSGTPNAE